MLGGGGAKRSSIVKTGANGTPITAARQRKPFDRERRGYRARVMLPTQSGFQRACLHVREAGGGDSVTGCVSRRGSDTVTFPPARRAQGGAS